MNRKLLAFYGLKWSPFSPGVPVEALYVNRQIEWFCWRVENLVSDGGFALVTGQPGFGKSIALRVLADKLGALQNIQVGILTRPQAGMSDFYRELGDLFGVPLRPHNRHAGSKVLRQRWQAHIDSSFSRPVLVADEAQEMSPAVLAELRLLSAVKLDSQVLLTVVFAGDQRLAERFRSDELLPLGSRIRARLVLERATSEDLQACLKHVLNKAGAPQLMTPEVIVTLSEHAQGNYRALMNMAGELLEIAAQRQIQQIDERLFLEAYTPQASQQNRTTGRQRR
jgi:general secretion pathway protein A